MRRNDGSTTRARKRRRPDLVDDLFAYLREEYDASVQIIKQHPCRTRDHRDVWTSGYKVCLHHLDQWLEARSQEQAGQS